MMASAPKVGEISPIIIKPKTTSTSPPLCFQESVKLRETPRDIERTEPNFMMLTIVNTGKLYCRAQRTKSSSSSLICNASTPAALTDATQAKRTTCSMSS